jgi:hypothetical protein
MGNIPQNLDLQRMRLSIRVSEMKLSLERADLRLVELEDEKNRILENREATKKEIDNLTKELGGIKNV